MPADGRIYFAGLALNLSRSKHRHGRQSGLLNRAVDLNELSLSRSTTTRADSTALRARDALGAGGRSLSSFSTFEEPALPRSSEEGHLNRAGTWFLLYSSRFDYRREQTAPTA